MASHSISLLTTRSCLSPWMSLMLDRISKRSPTPQPLFDCGSCITTYSSTQTSLRSSFLALHLSSGRLRSQGRRQQASGCAEDEVTRRNDRLVPAIRLSCQGGSEGVQLPYTCLRHLRPLLTDDMAQTVACSIVGTRLHYCNAALYGAPAVTFSVLQLGIAIPDLNFQSRDSGLSNSQSRDPVGIAVDY